MEPLRPIFWGQGMFLQPQHFQQQDIYHEARLRRSLQLLYPFCWGIHTLAINETALQSFVFEVEQCEWVSREGTILRFQAESTPSNARIVPRSFEADLHTDGSPLGVYLGLKRLQWEEQNVDSGQASERVNGASAPRRYSMQELLTPDLMALAADDDRSCSLHYLMHDVRILFDGDPALQNQGYERIKIAELLSAPDGRGAMLSKRYIPPALGLQASAVLEGLIKEIRDLLTAKGRELVEYRRPLGGRDGELGAREALSLLMLQAVNRYIPLFHHHLEVRQTHPCPLYALLRQFIGELSTFSDTVTVLGGPLPAYRHDQLWACFDAAVRVAKQLLSGVEKGPEYVVPLVYDNREYFVADLERRVFEGDNRCYLSVKGNASPQELERLLTVEGKIASREDMSVLRERFLPGLKLRHLTELPDDLPQRPQHLYFALNQHGTIWEHIAQRQNIAVYCPLPPHETEMQFLVLF
jgi:type VI secretion system protein ImpJ